MLLYFFGLLAWRISVYKSHIDPVGRPSPNYKGMAIKEVVIILETSPMSRTCFYAILTGKVTMMLSMAVLIFTYNGSLLNKLKWFFFFVGLTLIHANHIILRYLGKPPQSTRIITSAVSWAIGFEVVGFFITSFMIIIIKDIFPNLSRFQMIMPKGLIMTGILIGISNGYIGAYSASQGYTYLPVIYCLICSFIVTSIGFILGTVLQYYHQVKTTREDAYEQYERLALLK